MQLREFRFSAGSSNKFWSIELAGNKHIVCFGKIGTDGQKQTKTFSTADEAKKSYEKLIAEKTKKGYKEVPSAKVAQGSVAKTQHAGLSTPPKDTPPETVRTEAPGG